MIRLSIIVPVYNVEDYIATLAQSLLKQYDEDVEIIFVDDGSTDRSYQILSQFFLQSKHIRIIRQSNKGASNARNVGLNCAKGKYVAFVDSDDNITSDYVKKLLALTNYEYDLYQLEWLSLSSNGKFQKVAVDLPYGNCSIKDYASCIALQQSNPPWNKLYRREIIEKNDLTFNTSMTVGEDLAFSAEFLLHANSIYISNVCVYMYNDNPDGLCKKVNPQYFSDNALLYRILMKLNTLSCDNVNLKQQVDSGMVRSIFRTIGFCKEKKYTDAQIRNALEQSGLSEQFGSFSLNQFQDKFRKFLIEFKLYSVIQIMTRK